MAYWSIPAGQQIDYSANGDDIDSFSQKVKWCLEEIFNSLQYLHTNGSTGDIDAPAQAYEIRVDSSNGTLCIRNATNNDWITLGKLEEHFGIEPEDIGAIRNGGGIKKLDMGNLTVIDLNAEPLGTYSTGDVYISAKDKAVYWFTGSTWKTIVASGDGDDILTKSILVNQGSRANVGKVLKINEHGKLSTDITGSPGMLYDKAIVRRGELKNNQVLVYDSTENGNAGAFVNREIDAVVGGGITGGGNDCVVSGLSGKLLFTYGGTSSIYKEYDGKEDVSVDVTKCIKPLTIMQGNDTISYNGSYGHVVRIPSDSVLKDLFITENGVTRYYNGSSSMAITIPSYQQYGHYLTIKNSEGGKFGEYNGTKDVNITLRPLIITRGQSTLKYDGMIEQEITIPSANKTLTIQKNTTAMTYDGTENSNINLTNKKLVIHKEGEDDIEYDGSAEKVVSIPSGRMESLTITQGTSTLAVYNGSASKTVSLPAFPLPALTIKNNEEVYAQYDGTNAATINIATVNRTSELLHVKRMIVMNTLGSLNSSINYLNVDSAIYEKLSTTASHVWIDTTNSTMQNEVGFGMMLKNTNGGYIITNLAQTDFYSTRRADLFVVGGDINQGQMSAGVAFKTEDGEWYNGTNTLSSEKIFLPMGFQKRVNAFSTGEYMWHFSSFVAHSELSITRVMFKVTVDAMTATQISNNAEPTITYLAAVFDG